MGTIRQSVLLLSTSQMESTLCFLDGIFRQNAPDIPTYKLTLGTRAGTYPQQYPDYVIAGVLKLILEKQIGFIFISLIEYGLERAYHLISEIKKELDVVVIAGGPYAIEYPDACASKRFIDVVNYSHGLHSWKIVNEYPKLESVPNIIYQRSNMTWRNQPADIHYEMNDMPNPDWRLDNEYMLVNPYWWNWNLEDITGIVSLRNSGGALPVEHHQLPSKHTGVLILSVGCPVNTCEFCSISRMYDKESQLLVEQQPKLNKKLRKITWYSPNRAIEVIEEFLASRPNTQYILFNDNDFASIPEEYAEEFLSLYRDKIGLPFYCQSSPHLTAARGPEFMKKLVESGLDTYCMGVETSAQSNLTLYHRGGNENMVERAIKLVAHYSSERKISMALDFINGNAAETKEDLVNTINLIRSFPVPWDLAIHNLTLYDKTPLARKIREKLSDSPEIDNKLKTETSDYHHVEFNNFRPLKEIYYNVILEWLGGLHDEISIGRLPRNFCDYIGLEGVIEVRNSHPEFNQLLVSFDDKDISTYDFLLSSEAYDLLNVRLDILEALFKSVQLISYGYHRPDRYDFDWGFALDQFDL